MTKVTSDETGEKWLYSGDTNLEYGGVFIDLSEWDYGYCPAVRVTDLDNCGFRGAVIVEHIVILGIDDRDRIKKALKSCGIGKINGLSKQNLRLMIAEALMMYGFFDPDDDGYTSINETLQLESDGPMSFDGMKADKRLRGTTLEAYVRSVHLI